MAPEQAVAKVFVTAFKTLPFNEQRTILAQMFKLPRWRNDLVDIAIAELRSRQKSRPFRTFLAEIRK